MKIRRGNNSRFQYTRVPFDAQVETKIISAKSHKRDKCNTLLVDLKVVQEDVYVDAVVVKEAVDLPPAK